MYYFIPSALPKYKPKKKKKSDFFPPLSSIMTSYFAQFYNII